MYPASPMRAISRLVDSGSIRPRRVFGASGMTLMECTMALAMVAFALPVVMLAFGHSRSHASEARMDGEAQRVIPTHVRTLMREGFPVGAERLVWAHAANGACIGRADEMYDSGAARYLDQAVRYLVVAEWMEAEGSSGEVPERLRLSLEHPAAAPAVHRKRILVHSPWRP